MHAYRSLSPVTFLERSGQSLPSKLALVSAGRSLTFRALLHRVRCFAQVLVGRGIQPGDRVAVLCENSVAVIEAHFAVPSVGAVLTMVNPWLSDAELKQILEFSEPRLLLVDARYVPRICGVLQALSFSLLGGWFYYAGIIERQRSGDKLRQPLRSPGLANG